MSFARTLQLTCAIGALSWIAGCAEPVAPSQGWGLVDLPDVSPTSGEVLAAAKTVIQERYPRSSFSEKSGVVLALGPVTMDGGSKTRTQISVLAKRNYTGAYEPVVRVSYCVEVGQPGLLADPESGNMARAQPIRKQRWHVLDYRPYEEQEIYDAILDELVANAARAREAKGGAKQEADQKPAGA